MRARKGASRALLVLLLMFAAGCTAKAPPPAEAPESGESAMTSSAQGPRVVFSYPTIDGGVLSTETLAGRFSVIGFVTTYDTLSQAQARFLSAVVRRHVPRINAALLVLEPETNLPLIEAFAGALRSNVTARVGPA